MASLRLIGDLMQSDTTRRWALLGREICIRVGREGPGWVGIPGGPAESPDRGAPPRYSRTAYARSVRKSAVVVEHQVIQHVPGVLEPTLARPSQTLQLFVADGRVAVHRQQPAHAPQPQLRAGDLGRGRVLHQIVDRGRADAAQPRIDIGQRDPDVRPDAGVGDLSARDAEAQLAADTDAPGRSAFWFGASPRTERRSRSPQARGRGGRPTSRRTRHATPAPCPRGPWPVHAR